VFNERGDRSFGFVRDPYQKFRKRVHLWNGRRGWLKGKKKKGERGGKKKKERGSGKRGERILETVSGNGTAASDTTQDPKGKTSY